MTKEAPEKLWIAILRRYELSLKKHVLYELLLENKETVLVVGKGDGPHHKYSVCKGKTILAYREYE